MTLTHTNNTERSAMQEIQNEIQIKESIINKEPRRAQKYCLIYRADNELYVD